MSCNIKLYINDYEFDFDCNNSHPFICIAMIYMH